MREIVGGTEEEALSLGARLERSLREYLDAPRTIVGIQRTGAAYRTSYALERLDVELDDGSHLDVMFKDTSRGALHEKALAAKPLFLYDPLREIVTYREILARPDISTATLYGSVADADFDQYWLFIEYVPGWQLFEVDVPTWPHAARWLANMHSTWATDSVATNGDYMEHMVRYDEAYFRIWPERARRFVAWKDIPNSSGARETFDRIVARYDIVAKFLASLPRTFIHGEFFASNVLVVETGHEVRVCPVDWEMAGFGTPFLDIAALISGDWRPEDQDMVIEAYRAALPSGSVWRRDRSTFMTALDFSLLHLSMQWLGWAQGWTPPEEHRHNWLADVLRLGNKLLL